MKDDTQKDLLRLAKRAMVLVSSNLNEPDLVFELRDIIRKAESEMKGDGDVFHEVH